MRTGEMNQGQNDSLWSREGGLVHDVRVPSGVVGMFCILSKVVVIKGYTFANIH